jgi:Xaa-Pro aminopeptidase
MFRKLRESVKPGCSPAAAGERLKEIPSAPARDSLQAYGLGNGIGLEIAEEPFLGSDGRIPIQPGMVLTLRVCLAGGKCGHALISQPCLIGPGGAESLAKSSEDLVVIQG